MSPTTTSLPFSPVCCFPEAFGLMHRQLAAPGDGAGDSRLATKDGLLAAAVAVAMHRLPQASVEEVEAQVDALADTVRRRVVSDSPRAVLAHLHEVLFELNGFRGNGQDYYNPKNSFLPVVLASRRGLPIVLSLIYKLVAERVGLRAWGVGLPGHFVAGVEADGDPMLIDPYHGGRLISRSDAADLIRSTAGADIPLSDDLLRAVTHRHWITRLIQNLLHVFTATGDYTDVAAMLELEMLLWPDQLHLQRDLGLVLARVGLPRPATHWLHRYLDVCPNDPQRDDLEELLAVLR